MSTGLCNNSNNYNLQQTLSNNNNNNTNNNNSNSNNNSNINRCHRLSRFHPEGVRVRRPAYLRPHRRPPQQLLSLVYINILRMSARTGTLRVQGRCQKTAGLSEVSDFYHIMFIIVIRLINFIMYFKDDVFVICAIIAGMIIIIWYSIRGDV